MCNFVPRLILMMMVGRLQDGPMLLSGVGMGSMYNNICGQSFIIATSFGATSLLSQAFGAKNFVRVGQVLQRMLLIHLTIFLLLVVPLAVWCEPLLLAAGQPADVAAITKRFVWGRVFAMPFVILSTDLTAFLAAQRIARTPMWITLASAALTLVLSCVLVRDDSLGYDGAAVTLSIGEAFSGLAMLAATPRVLPRHGRASTWPVWSWRDATRGWGECLMLAAPSAVVVMSEWAGWEASVLMAGWLCPTPPPRDVLANATITLDATECTELEAFPILSQTMVVLFLAHFGFSIACGNRVGNLLGEDQPKRAKTCALATLGFVLAFVSLMCAALIGLKHHWASFFLGAADATAASRQVAATVAAVLPIVAAYIFLDTIGPAWAHQILFGVGRLTYPMLNNFLSFWVLGLPLGHHLAFGSGWDLAGLWFGLVCGMAALDGGLLVYLLAYLDWGLMARDARRRALKGAGTSEAGATSGTECTFASAGAEPVHLEGDRVGLASADSAAARHAS